MQNTDLINTLLAELNEKPVVTSVSPFNANHSIHLFKSPYNTLEVLSDVTDDSTDFFYKIGVKIFIQHVCEPAIFLCESKEETTLFQLFISALREFTILPLS